MQVADAKTAPTRKQAAHHQSLSGSLADAIRYASLDKEARTHVDTACAAYHLSRRPRTLRAWASGELSGPIAPTRINGRLLWSVADLRRVLRVGEAAQ